MNKLLPLFFLLSCLTACGQINKTVNNNINPEAEKLNLLAIDTVYDTHGQQRLVAISTAIDFLNKAISIDSTYFTAYWNKLQYQLRLKNYNDAYATCKHLIKFLPGDSNHYTTLGFVSIKMGDSILAKSCFEKSYKWYNSKTDTMKAKNNTYRIFQGNKAVALIMLGKRQEGHDILNLLLISETNPILKNLYMKVLNSTNDEITDIFLNDSYQILKDKHKNGD